MTVDEQAAIQFINVNFSANEKHILKNINGSILQGEITTLVGPSGAGKSTLFTLCNGLQSPDSGKILINGQEILKYNPVDLRRKVGIALQNATMINGTVLKNLELPMTLQDKQLPYDRAVELIQVVGLDEEFLGRNTKDLSGGQRQKVSIARTLVNRPKVLLLDEITSSLDRVSQQDIEELIKKINEKYGTTIVWITHNLNQAITVGTYTWVMMNGEVVETGKSSLLLEPTNEKVKLFVKGEVK